MDMENRTSRGGRRKNKDNASNEKSLLPQKRYFRQRAHSNPICDHDFD